MEEQHVLHAILEQEFVVNVVQEVDLIVVLINVQFVQMDSLVEDY